MCSMQDLQLYVTYFDHGWPMRPYPGDRPKPESSDEKSSIQQASECYATKIIPALKEIERLSLHPLLQADFEVLLAKLPHYYSIR